MSRNEARAIYVSRHPATSWGRMGGGGTCVFTPQLLSATDDIRGRGRGRPSVSARAQCAPETGSSVNGYNAYRCHHLGPFGRMLMSFEGWPFKLEIHDRSKEIR